MKRIAARSIVGLALIASAIWCWNFSENRLHGSPAPYQGEEHPSLGKTIYEARCTICHGSEGKGDGVAAAMLHPRPRDLTAGKYKYRTTETGTIPTDKDLERTIREG